MFDFLKRLRAPTSPHQLLPEPTCDDPPQHEVTMLLEHLMDDYPPQLYWYGQTIHPNCEYRLAYALSRDIRKHFNHTYETDISDKKLGTAKRELGQFVRKEKVGPKQLMAYLFALENPDFNG